jgi:hypothetical protein
MLDAERVHEIERNFQAFQIEMAKMPDSEDGKFALLHGATIQGVFEKLADAIVAGHRQFSDGMFSIQEVSREALDLGYFSHANSEGTLRQG